MAQVVYPGTGYKAPQTRGMALQALSQFGQQEQGRKTYELETARKDRDKVLEMMKIDPVYATSLSLQNRQAQILDEYLDNATLVAKEISQKKGRPSTQDFMKMQQSQGLAMAQMERLNAIDKEMTKAGQLVQSRPDLYDPKMYQKSVDYVNENYDMPQEGFLFPAFQSIDKIFSANKEKEQSLKTEWVTENGEKVAYKVPAQSADVNPETRVRRAIMAYRNNEIMSPGQRGGVAYNTHYEYDEFPEETQRQYESMAEEMGLNSGAEAFVAERAMNTLWSGEKAQPWRMPSKGSGGPAARGEMKYTTNLEEGWIGDATLGKRDVIYDKDTKEIVFTNEITEPEVSVPVEYVKFDKDVDLGEMEEIKLIPKRGRSGEVQWEVADDVSVTKSGLTREELKEKYPEQYRKGEYTSTSKKIVTRAKTTLRREKSEDVKLYNVKIPLTGITAKTKYSDVDDILNAKYRQELKPFWRQTIGGEGKPPSGAYTINGYDYTAEELRAAGYSEEQIRQLSNE